MKKNEIGSFINKGMTSQEIQERIKDFPAEPSIQDFMKLGYSKNTARTYRYQLKKNNQNADNQKPKNDVVEVAHNDIKEKKITQNTINNKNNNLIKSPNANMSKIILDTSALGNKKTVKIIKSASSVTVLYPTIKEFDTVGKNKKSRVI